MLMEIDLLVKDKNCINIRWCVNVKMVMWVFLQKYTYLTSTCLSYTN